MYEGLTQGLDALVSAKVESCLSNYASEDSCYLPGRSGANLSLYFCH